MKVNKFFNPICEENMYVVSLEDNNCYIVDPGDIYMTKVLNYIKENNLILKAVLLTHGHFDHILGLQKVLDYKEVPVYISEIDKDYLYDPKKSLSYMIGNDFKLEGEHDIRVIKDGDKVYEFDVISTPGHTSGSVCFYNAENKVLLSGDTILYKSHGRVDFPTGNMNDMVSSIRKLINLPDDVTIYSGHGPTTILKDEKKYYKYY